MELKILHTTDIHSNYENFAKVVSKLEEFKDDNTIILDAGDFADFKRMELQGTKGLAAVELLERAGYDAITIGNNETFDGVETLTHMATTSKVPFLSSNLQKVGGFEIKGVSRSIVVDKNGLKILLIGLSPDLGVFYELDNLEVREYLKAIKGEIDRHRGNYDVCIILSHLGLPHDKVIAQEIEEVDIIIGGHFHILMDQPEIVNNKIIHTSGEYGKHLGLVRVNIDDGKVELLEAQNMNIEDLEPANEIIDLLKDNKEKALDNLSQPLYNIEVDLWHDMIEENPMTNLLADALVDVLKCDIGIINSGVINGGIRKGPVSRKKLLEICPSPLNPTTFEIEGKYLMEALQDSLESEVCLMDGRGPGFRGHYLGRLHVANAKIEHDGRKVINIFINDEKLVNDKLYTVASSDYLHRGTGYTSLKNNRNEKYNKEFLRDTLQDYIAKHEFVRQAFIDRWVLKEDLG